MHRLCAPAYGAGANRAAEARVRLRVRSHLGMWLNTVTIQQNKLLWKELTMYADEPGSSAGGHRPLLPTGLLSQCPIAAIVYYEVRRSFLRKTRRVELCSAVFFSYMLNILGARRAHAVSTYGYAAIRYVPTYASGPTAFFSEAFSIF